LVGINLLREGLDLPEVSLVCILDADKEGFLRSQTSLIQTAGRAARHVNGEVVLFADQVTHSMEALMSISEYRRVKQMEYNETKGRQIHPKRREPSLARVGRHFWGAHAPRRNGTRARSHAISFHEHRCASC